MVSSMQLDRSKHFVSAMLAMAYSKDVSSALTAASQMWSMDPLMLPMEVLIPFEQENNPKFQTDLQKFAASGDDSVMKFVGQLRQAVDTIFMPTYDGEITVMHRPLVCYGGVDLEEGEVRVLRDPQRIDPGLFTFTEVSFESTGIRRKPKKVKIPHVIIRAMDLFSFMFLDRCRAKDCRQAFVKKRANQQYCTEKCRTRIAQQKTRRRRKE